jgi:hypothetical protein
MFGPASEIGKHGLGVNTNFNSISVVLMRYSVVQLMGCDMPLYAFSLFLPSIINQVWVPKGLLTPYLADYAYSLAG